MEEGTLVKWLVVVGIVSLSAVTVSNFFLGNMLIRFSSSLVPFALCQTDSNGNYLLAQPSSNFLCSEMSDTSRITGNPTICDGYSGSQKSACLKLIDVAKNRTQDCLANALGRNQTSVNPLDVKQSCALLNVTASAGGTGSSSSSSIAGAIAGKAFLPINNFVKNFK